MNKHVILDNITHRDLRVSIDAAADLGDAVMGCLTVPSEFRQVQAHFPIVFRRDLESDNFSALALFGFENGENLFLEDGRWDAGYKPLAHDIQPFLIGRIESGDQIPQVHIDMDHPRTNGTHGVRLFDPEGAPTPYLEIIAEKLGALDTAYRESGAFFEALKRYDLLEPFSLEVPLNDGS